MKFPKTLLALLASVLLCTTMAGCPGDIDLDDFLEDLEVNIVQSVNSVQTIDPRNDVTLIGDAANTTVIIDDRADVIVDVSDQLIYDELLDINLIGFENFTGNDIYITFLVDGVEQGVFVYADETLLLEYPCVELIQLIEEEDYDPFTGALIDFYDLTGLNYFNGDFYADPVDFFCGDALILTIDPFAVTASADLIDLR